MPSPILAFRPGTVTARLPRRNEACPLSLRDVLRALPPGGGVLPIVRAPIAGVARGALVAAREARSALGLALPPGVPPEPWFAAVVEAADAVAAGLPLVLSGEVRVDGAGDEAVDRAVHEAWRLVEAGLTHLSVDLAPVPARGRPAAFAQVARGAAERGLGVELLLPDDGAAGPLVAALAGHGVLPDAVGVRGAAPADGAAALAHAARLAAVAAELEGLAVVRRGATTAELARALAGGPVRACEDGGAAATAALSVLPWELLERPGDEGRTSPLERAAAELDAEGADRLEARAWAEVRDLVEALGAAGSADAIADALARELLEDRA